MFPEQEREKTIDLIVLEIIGQDSLTSIMYVLIEICHESSIRSQNITI